MGEAVGTVTVKIKGMTCHSCEERVQKAMVTVPGVLSAEADHSRNRVCIGFDPARTNANKILEQIPGVLKDSPYELQGLFSERHWPSQASSLVAGAILIALFLLMNAQGWFSFLPRIDSTISLGMIFIAGLLTSVHCVAMCGGIALGQQSAPPPALGDSETDPAQAADQGRARLKASLRGLQYHLGRVVSYTLLGAIVGALGSVLNFSPLAKGIVAGLAGLFMLVMGLRMLGLLPRFQKIRLNPFKGLSTSSLGVNLRKKGPFFVGLLNGLMPCGPLQTMQLYALGTGSAALGALSMFLFSLGTVPLMFTFGALASFFKPSWQRRIVQASAVLVIFFGLLMFGRALDLSGSTGMIQSAIAKIPLPLAPAAAQESPIISSTDKDGTVTARIKDGVQYASFDLQPGTYAPLRVQKGIPLEWTINARAENINGCNKEITIPGLGITKKLQAGPNVIRFTPQDSGTITYTCWMGMISSSITVVNKLDQGTGTGTAASQSGEGPPPGRRISLPSGDAQTGSACCGGSTNPAFAGGKIPADSLQTAQIKTENGQQIQEITVTVDDQGYSPAVLVLQKGIPARIKFAAKKLDSCNQYVYFPEYGGGLDLGKDLRETPLLTVAQDFTFQCGMAMLHGYAGVVDDLANYDSKALKARVLAWKPAQTGGSMGCCNTDGQAR